MSSSASLCQYVADVSCFIVKKTNNFPSESDQSMSRCCRPIGLSFSVASCRWKPSIGETMRWREERRRCPHPWCCSPTRSSSTRTTTGATTPLACQLLLPHSPSPPLSQWQPTGPNPLQEAISLLATSGLLLLLLLLLLSPPPPDLFPLKPLHQCQCHWSCAEKWTRVECLETTRRHWRCERWSG